ncbi:flavodoxin family protein [Vibrio sp. VPAP30]|uniref:flavodoxin family protein n=1 Tax=Vibrio sp. VPAP30 TaxID=1647102 RepID=UPI000657F23D|nr:NAD(P)H-dependent oxidoreductase [Vibrio sp. VPAP30]KLN63444.1 FMN reductase [Vibrio sp. VPAP30]
MKTLILFSSANKQGNTAKTIEYVQADHNVEVVDIDSLAITPYCYENDYPADDFYPLVDKMLASDNLVFASPIYWYSVTAPMKALVDRMTELLDVAELKPKARALESKRGFVITSSGKSEICPIFDSFFTGLFRYFNIEYTANLHAACNNGYAINQDDLVLFNKALNLV